MDLTASGGIKKIGIPFDKGEHLLLTAGEMVLLSGVVYCARDAAHQRFSQTLLEGKALPIDLKGQTLFYAAPTPAKDGEIIGAIGPTTSARMDVFTPDILRQMGLAGMIGKGARSEAVRQAIAENKAVYFGALGGVAALTRKCVRSARIIAYEDLAAEAVLMLEIENLPAIVLIDSTGRSYHAKPT